MCISEGHGGAGTCWLVGQRLRTAYIAVCQKADAEGADGGDDGNDEFLGGFRQGRE